MKTLKVMVALLLTLVLITPIVFAEPVFKGNDLYDGWSHEVYVDNKTGEVTIIGHPTKEEQERADEVVAKNMIDNERLRQEDREDYNRAEDRTKTLNVNVKQKISQRSYQYTKQE